MAAPHGLEPWYQDPESCVLPIRRQGNMQLFKVYFLSYCPSRARHVLCEGQGNPQNCSYGTSIVISARTYDKNKFKLFFSPILDQMALLVEFLYRDGLTAGEEFFRLQLAVLIIFLGIAC